MDGKKKPATFFFSWSFKGFLKQLENKVCKTLKGIRVRRVLFWNSWQRDPWQQKKFLLEAAVSITHIHSGSQKCYSHLGPRDWTTLDTTPPNSSKHNAESHTAHCPRRLGQELNAKSQHTRKPTPLYWVDKTFCGPTHRLPDHLSKSPQQHRARVSTQLGGHMRRPYERKRESKDAWDGERKRQRVCKHI